MTRIREENAADLAHEEARKGSVVFNPGGLTQPCLSKDWILLGSDPEIAVLCRLLDSASADLFTVLASFRGPVCEWVVARIALTQASPARFRISWSETSVPARAPWAGAGASASVSTIRLICCVGLFP